MLVNNKDWLMENDETKLLSAFHYLYQFKKNGLITFTTFKVHILRK